ncbi:MAG: Ldh family oxidoreductase [Microgenomates group bacterium]
MKIPISQVESTFRDLLTASNASHEDIETIISILMEQALYNNKFSPFSSATIENINKHLRESKDIQEKIVVDRPSIKLIDAQGKFALLVGMKMAGMVSEMAKTQGIGMVGMYNSTYHDMMSVYSRHIAEHNLIGIVCANGGPAGVVPFGGLEPIFGTNPISYAIPTQTTPIVFDGATAQYAYGTIHLAKAQKKKLEDFVYVDKKGAFTTDPEKAIGLIPFGGYKGYAINLLLEVLTGIFVRAKSGLAVQNEKDLGSLFIAIDPTVFGDIDEFKKQATQLVNDILKSPSRDSKSPVRIPGKQSEEYKQKIIKDEFFEIDDAVWKEFAE